MEQPQPSLKTIVLIFGALLTLLGLSAISSRYLTGMPGTAVALFFAVAKLLLIFGFFMRLKYQSSLVRLFAAAGFLWLALMGVFIFADYFTRV